MNVAAPKGVSPIKTGNDTVDGVADSDDEAWSHVAWTHGSYMDLQGRAVAERAQCRPNRAPASLADVHEMGAFGQPVVQGGITGIGLVAQQHQVQQQHSKRCAALCARTPRGGGLARAVWRPR